MAQHVVAANTKLEITQKIDELLSSGQKIKPIALILAATPNTYRWEYRGFKIRAWLFEGEPRYDIAYEDQDSAD